MIQIDGSILGRANDSTIVRFYGTWLQRCNIHSMEKGRNLIFEALVWFYSVPRFSISASGV